MDNRFFSKDHQSTWYITSILFKRLSKHKTLLCPATVQRGRPFGIETVGIIAPAPLYTKEGKAEGVANKCKVGWFYSTIEKCGTGMGVKTLEDKYRSIPAAHPHVDRAFAALITEDDGGLRVVQKTVELGHMSSAQIRKLIGTVHKQDVHPIMVYRNNKKQLKALWPWNVHVDDRMVDPSIKVLDMDWHVCHVAPGCDGFTMATGDNDELVVDYPCCYN